MTEEFKTGHHYCMGCHGYTFHSWCSPIDAQLYETWPDNIPIPDDIFACLRCLDPEGYEETGYLADEDDYEAI